MNLMAAVSFIAYPCAPPRLMVEYGFVDMINKVSGVDVYASTRRWVNPYAAMPSMHMGYSLLFTLSGIGMIVASLKERYSAPGQGYERLESTNNTQPKRLPSLYVTIICLLPYIGLLYPVFMFFVIIATANHFILDAMAGATAFLVAWVAYPLLRKAWSKLSKNSLFKKGYFFTRTPTENNNESESQSESESESESGSFTSSKYDIELKEQPPMTIVVAQA